MRVTKRSGLEDAALRKAVAELNSGLHDGDLGRGVFKKRIGSGGRGKRGSFRTIVATRSGSTWFYLFAFKKNERSDVTHAELEALRDLAIDLGDLNQQALDLAVRNGALMEIVDGEDYGGERHSRCSS